MFFGSAYTHDLSVYQARRKELIALIRANNEIDDRSVVVLSSGLEADTAAYRPDSSFFYFSGVSEPGVVLVLSMNGDSTLYIPRYTIDRRIWVTSDIEASAECAKEIGVTAVEFLGDSVPGYALNAYPQSSSHGLLMTFLKDVIAQGGTVFAPLSKESNFREQMLYMHFLFHDATFNAAFLKDCSAEISQLRRIKDAGEIELMYEAVRITAVAQEAALNCIEDGANEADVQAGIEYVMTSEHAKPAFPSIVGSGMYGTVLHYTHNNNQLTNGDLVVVDIGARKKEYCADITRTYPVSGTFTARQRALYELVYDTQMYIADIAAPGYWINNAQYPEKSLNHLAKKFLAHKGGYDRYFVHGIGHFLGLDVHDVGDASQPLQEGDVITIEPGIYIPEERIGIRIEDNYWIVAGGAVCLSESIAKKVADIELLMKQRFADAEIAPEDDGQDLDFDDDYSSVNH